MRLLVVGSALGAEDRRLAMAATGLAARGHHVLWLGGGDLSAAEQHNRRVFPPPRPTDHETTPAQLRPIEVAGWRGLLGGVGPRADLVLGGGRHTVRTAIAGWLAGARAMGIAGVPEGETNRVLSRWCWESLDAFAMLDPGAAEEVTVAGIEPEQCVTWSDAPVSDEPDPEHPDCEILERACERWLAHRNGPGAPAAFLDRDGTLVVERGYLTDADEIELLPGVAQALRQLRAAGYALVVVSNQSGVARGFFPRRRVFEAMARLRVLLRRHGVELDAIYFCPHRPEAGCSCRKPGTELLERAATNLNLSLERSVMIGDKRLDVATGHRGRALGILVRTGYGDDEFARSPSGEFERPPDLVADSLVDAARWLTTRH